MVGRKRACVLVVLTLLWLPGCSTNSPLGPGAGGEVFSEVFQGTLSAGMLQQFHPFVVQQRGTVTLLLQNVFQPATSLQITVGLAVGTWDGENCALLVKNDMSTANTVIAGSALPGTYCATIYDVGNVGANPVNYTIEATHR